jgi:hypothetical protein
MAFGFPAYHTEILYKIPRRIDLREYVFKTLARIGWEAHYVSRHTISASVGVSFWSWGENITIEIHPDGPMSVTSSCTLPTQCFDWGKNKKNVNKFITELRKLMALQSLQDDPGPADGAIDSEEGQSRKSQGIQDRRDHIK